MELTAIELADALETVSEALRHDVRQGRTSPHERLPLYQWWALLTTQLLPRRTKGRAARATSRPRRTFAVEPPAEGAPLAAREASL